MTQRGSLPSPCCYPIYRRLGLDRRRGCCKRDTSLHAEPGCRSRSLPASSLGYPASANNLPALSLRHGLCRSQRAFWHPRQLRFVGNEFGPAHCRIEDVVAVLVAQFRKTGRNFAVTLLFLFRQTYAREFKVAQCVINRFLLRRVQRGVMIAIAQVAIRFIQPFMLPYRVLYSDSSGRVCS